MWFQILSIPKEVTLTLCPLPALSQGGVNQLDTTALLSLDAPTGILGGHHVPTAQPSAEGLCPDVPISPGRPPVSLGPPVRPEGPWSYQRPGTRGRGWDPGGSRAQVRPAPRAHPHRPCSGPRHRPPFHARTRDGESLPFQSSKQTFRGWYKHLIVFGSVPIGLRGVEVVPNA